MENKIDWSKIDKEKFCKLFVEKFIEHENRRLDRFRAYWNYQLFTPWYIKIWNKITLKKTPQL